MATAHVCLGCGCPLSSVNRSGHWRCKPCETKRVYAWVAKDRRKYAWFKARNRAKVKGQEFAVTLDDMPEIPERCPVFGVLLVTDGSGGPDGPSLDRIDPSKGYVPGNLRFMSWRANALLSDASFDEIKAMYNYLKGEQDGRQDVPGPGPGPGTDTLQGRGLRGGGISM